mmetsp:Transcript_20927/g.66013  ORF Transcript_20927/g.66013 Transcript_20927/m.66013 type:complete len:210 (-) Transcript_20927:502-1131(-)
MRGHRKVRRPPGAHLRRRPVEAQLPRWVPLPSAADRGVGVHRLPGLYRDHEAEVDDLQPARRPPVQEEDVAAAEVPVDHAEALHVDEGLAAVPHDAALLALLQGRRAVDDRLQQPALDELHDDVGAARQGRLELVLRPGEPRLLEAPAEVVEVLRPVRREAGVVLEVPHEEPGGLRLVPRVAGVVQPLHGPPGLAVKRIDMPILLRVLR